MMTMVAMTTGLLWFDDDPKRPWEAKIAPAMQRFREKFGCLPNICYVHPSSLPNKTILVPSLRVIAAHDILPYHLWIGIADVSPEQPDAERCSSS